MKNTNKGYTLMELMTVIGLFVGVAFFGGMLYVAIHFLSKVW